MKKIRMIVCYIIVIMLVLSFAPTAFAEGARGGAVTTVVSNVVKMAGGRAAQELSAYSIANDVPVLGDLFYFFCDPGQRAELEHKATVNKIYSTVQEIKSAIEVLDSKLENLQNIIETNHAESIFYSAKDKIDLISAKYTTAQSKYEIAVKAINDYANASEETKASYEAIASAAIKDFVAAVDSNSLINFENDLANLNNAVYKSGDSTTYLPALENYLREAYPFEHMITEKMYDGFTYSEGNSVQWKVCHNRGTTIVRAITESIALARFMAKYPNYQVTDIKRVR